MHKEKEFVWLKSCKEKSYNLLMAVSARWNGKDAPCVMDYILILLVYAVSMVMFMYADVFATVEHSFNFLDSLFSGRVLDFYQIAIEHSAYSHPAVYDIPIYIIFGVWNLPAYIINKFVPFDYTNNFISRLWIKTMILVFVIAAAFVLYKICKELRVSDRNAKWAVVFFLSSVMVVVPAMIIAQYDIMAVTFMLLGILAYIKEDDKKFILWFVLANCMKLFGIFIFIPLILLKEKRVFAAILKTLAGISGVVVCKLIYSGNVAYQASTKAFSGFFLRQMESISFKWYNEASVLPLFVAAMAGVCIFAYYKRNLTGGEIKRYILYLPLVVFGAFLLLVPFNPYWIILIAPFIVLAVFTSSQNRKLYLLLELAIEAALTYLSTYFAHQVFGGETLINMFADKIFRRGMDAYGITIMGVFDKLYSPVYVDYVIAFLAVCVITILWLNYPQRKSTGVDMGEKAHERVFVWIRICIIIAFFGALCYTYAYSWNEIIYSAIGREYTESKCNLVDGESEIEQRMQFDRPLDMRQMIIDMSGTEEFIWSDSSILEIKLENMETGEVLWEKAVPVNTIESDQIKIRLKHIVLDKDTEYNLRLSGYNGEDHPLSVCYNKDSGQFETFENGKKISGDIAMIIRGRWVE